MNGNIINAVGAWSSYKKDLLFVCSIFLIFLLSSMFYMHGKYSAFDFVAEVGNVAASVARGEGFANVFGKDTGYTAWCPPAIVLPFAIIFKIFGIKTYASFIAIIVFQALCLSLAGLLLIKLDYPGRMNSHKWVLGLIFTGYSFILIVPNFPNDTFLYILINAWILFSLQRWHLYGWKESKWLLLVMCVVVPLTSIAMVLGLICIFTFLLVLKKRISTSVTLYSAGTVMALILLVSAGWGVRNSMRLHQFIPFKSNLWFEAHMSNVADSDGLIKNNTLLRNHPYCNKHVLVGYTDQGETRFLEKYKIETVDYIRHNPGEFILKAANRLKIAFLIPESHRNTGLVEKGTLPVNDLNVLKENEYILSNPDGNDYWVNLEDPPARFFEELMKLPVSGTHEIEQHWLEQQAQMQVRVRNQRRLKTMLTGYMLSLIPVIFLLIALFNPEYRKSFILLTALCLFICNLGPYILISFYERYQFMQMTFYVIFVFFGVSTILDRFQYRQSNVRKSE